MTYPLPKSDEALHEIPGLIVVSFSRTLHRRVARCGAATNELNYDIVDGRERMSHRTVELGRCQFSGMHLLGVRGIVSGYDGLRFRAADVLAPAARAAIEANWTPPRVNVVAG